MMPNFTVSNKTLRHILILAACSAVLFVYFIFRYSTFRIHHVHTAGKDTTVQAPEKDNFQYEECLNLSRNVSQPTQASDLCILHSPALPWLQGWAKRIKNNNALEESIYYNRINKCGSSYMINVISRMKKLLGFRVGSAMYPFIRQFWWNTSYHLDLMRKAEQESENLIGGNGTIYMRHTYFSAKLLAQNGTKQRLQRRLLQPIFINLIRDPVTRLESWWSARNHNTKPKISRQYTTWGATFEDCFADKHPPCLNFGGTESNVSSSRKLWWTPHEQLYYFSGTSEGTLTNLTQALKLAIRNIDKYYLIVGLNEKLPDTLEMLQFLLPEYFAGAKDIAKDKRRINSSRYTKLGDARRLELKERLHVDYQLYNYVAEQFEQRLNLIRHLKLGGLKDRRQFYLSKFRNSSESTVEY